MDLGGAVVVDVLPADVEDRGSHHDRDGDDPEAVQEAELADREVAGVGTGGLARGERREALGGVERDAALFEARDRLLLALGLAGRVRGVGLRAGAAASEQRAHLTRASSVIRACSPSDAVRMTSSTRPRTQSSIWTSSRLSVMPRTTRLRAQRTIPAALISSKRSSVSSISMRSTSVRLESSPPTRRRLTVVMRGRAPSEPRRQGLEHRLRVGAVRAGLRGREVERLTRVLGERCGEIVAHALQRSSSGHKNAVHRARGEKVVCALGWTAVYQERHCE